MIFLCHCTILGLDKIIDHVINELFVTAFFLWFKVTIDTTMPNWGYTYTHLGVSYTSPDSFDFNTVKWLPDMTTGVMVSYNFIKIDGVQVRHHVHF
jgi:hypothetical protein